MSREMTNSEAIFNLNHLIYGIVSPDIQRSLDLAIKALEKAPAVSEKTTLVTLSDGYGHVREAYYDEGRQLVFTEYISVKELDSRFININERKELNDNEDSQL